MKIEIYYDKECPFCNFYANYIELKERNDLLLFNARETKEQIIIFKKEGFDINDGFIIRIDNKKLYQGAEAIILLNKISKRKVPFYDNFVFKVLIYKLIKNFRKLVLIFKNKKIKI